MSNKKEPIIRFKGYTDGWVQRKLSDIVDSVDTGKSKFDKEGASGEYPILGSTSVIGYDDGYDYEGDFILTARVGANAGSLYRHTGKVKISDNTVFIQTLQNIEFIYYLLTQFDIKTLSFGTGQPLVKASELKNLELLVPTDMVEQMRIGEYFKNLDNLIALHQLKGDDLQEVKKYMLQKLFPQNGDKIPEIRFAGFTGEWEQQKLGDVLQFQNGFNGGREAYGEGTAFISVMDILNNQFITYDCIRGKATVTDDELERFSVRYGDVLFQRSSENVEDAGTSNVYVDNEKTAIFGGFVIRGRQVAPYSPRFMKYLLDTKTVRNQITKKAQGAQHVNVSQETLQDVQITLPSQREQEAVESCLCNLDNLITMHQRKCDDLKEFKKFMLQNMFPRREASPMGEG